MVVPLQDAASKMEGSHEEEEEILNGQDGKISLEMQFEGVLRLPPSPQKVSVHRSGRFFVGGTADEPSLLAMELLLAPFAMNFKGFIGVRLEMKGFPCPPCTGVTLYTVANDGTRKHLKTVPLEEEWMLSPSSLALGCPRFVSVSRMEEPGNNLDGTITLGCLLEFQCKTISEPDSRFSNLTFRRLCPAPELAAGAVGDSDPQTSPDFPENASNNSAPMAEVTRSGSSNIDGQMQLRVDTAPRDSATGVIPFCSETSEDPDVTLEFSSGTVILCHERVLAAGSKVLAAMLSHPCMAEGRSKRVRIQEYSLECVGTLLEFLYTGRVRGGLGPVVHELYVAADYYDVSLLKEQCLEFVLLRINKETVLRVLRDTLSWPPCPVLTARCLECIRRNRRQILGSPALKDLVLREPGLGLHLLQEALDSERCCRLLREQECCCHQQGCDQDLVLSIAGTPSS